MYVFKKEFFVYKNKSVYSKKRKFCYIVVLAFETRKQFVKHNLSDEHLNRARKKYDDELEDETRERVYSSDEDDYVLRPKDLRSRFANNTKDIIKTKTETETKAKTKTDTDDNLYTRIKFECKECHEEFRNKIALTTHSYSHNSMYLENREDFDTNSSQNMREFYITDKGGNYIEDIDEATNYSSEEIKNCYQFRKVKSFTYKITAECEYQKRTKEEVKTTKIFFNFDYIINNAIYENGDFTQSVKPLHGWLNFEKEIYEGYSYDFEFLGLRSIQINIEPTKASIGSYIDLPPDLKNSKSILNIRSYKYHCLQLTIIAWLYPAMHHATLESKYQNKLIEPRKQHEDDFGYILRKQKLYNINIWVYTSCGGGKVDLFKPVDDFDKDRKDVRILVWADGTTEHCALIKNIETLLDRPNKNNIKYFYCDRCTFWFDSQIKYDKHELTLLSNPRLFVLRRRKLHL